VDVGGAVGGGVLVAAAAWPDVAVGVGVCVGAGVAAGSAVGVRVSVGDTGDNVWVGATVQVVVGVGVSIVGRGVGSSVSVGIGGGVGIGPQALADRTKSTPANVYRRNTVNNGLKPDRSTIALLLTPGTYLLNDLGPRRPRGGDWSKGPQVIERIPGNGSLLPY
jgi:hypothetical protein